MNFEQLVAARLVQGLGVSALITSATMAVADISTPINRARMLAPVMAAFSAGTVLGPAAGGFLAGSIGLQPTFFVVGSLFFANLAYTR